MLLQIYWTNCFSLHIASNNLSAKKRRKFTARNASLCPSLNVWENHKYFTNKLQVSMRTWKNKKDLALGNTIKRTFANANSYRFADKQHFKVFRLTFSETIPIFFIRLNKWFYPCLIAMKFSPLINVGLNSREIFLNKKVPNDSN